MKYIKIDVSKLSYRKFRSLLQTLHFMLQNRIKCSALMRAYEEITNG